MSEQKLVEKAQAAVGGTDTIVAAAWFHPRGTAGGVDGGSAIGSSIGRASGNGLVGLVGALAGGVAGYELERHADDALASAGGQVHRVPFESLVALSEARIYAWRIHAHIGHAEPKELVFSLDRQHIAVTVHQRVSVRTVTIEDQESGARWELESERIDGHLTYILDELHPVEVSGSASASAST